MLAALFRQDTTVPSIILAWFEHFLPAFASVAAIPKSENKTESILLHTSLSNVHSCIKDRTSVNKLAVLYLAHNQEDAHHLPSIMASCMSHPLICMSWSIEPHCLNSWLFSLNLK